MFKKHAFPIVFFFFLFLFSFWLMWQSFGYHDSTIFVSSKVWGDFAANLPLIRSFSLGNNFPPEYPLFPGEPIRYHFLFYLVVGLLEKMGWRLDWALNLPSALSFFFLALMIYLLAKELFKSKTVAFLSVLFFLFNGTFSFLQFLKTHPISLNPASHFPLLTSIFRLTDFPSFMPYGPGEVTAFWSLNTFINQRHLALGFGVLLLIVYFLLRHSGETVGRLQNPDSGHIRQAPFNFVQGRQCKQARTTTPARMTIIIFFGLLFGLFPSLHKAVLVMATLIFFCLFLFFKKLRKAIIFIILISFIIALPQLYFTNQLNAQTQTAISFYPGYLVNGQGLFAFLRHWLWNLGLNVFLIPIGFILAPGQVKKVFLAFFSLFVIGNLFKFSPEIAANHKFFNLFIIVGNMFSAYGLVRILSLKFIKFIKIIIFIMLVFFLTFSGVIDLFVIKNDFQYQITDSPKNPDVLWIKNNTPPKSVFLSSSYFYHPANLAGRKIFYGWPYYAWSAGYQTEERKELVKQIFNNQSVGKLCQLLKINKIDYVALDKEPQIEEVKTMDQDFWKKNFLAAYANEVSGLKIYQTEAVCLGSF